MRYFVSQYCPNMLCQIGSLVVGDDVALLGVRLQVGGDAAVEDAPGQVGEQLDQQSQGRLARRVRALQGGNSMGMMG